MTAMLQRGRGLLEGLWPVGLSALQLVLIRRWAGLEGEPYEWCQYLALGLLAFGGLLLLEFGRRRDVRLLGSPGPTRAALGGVGVAACVAYAAGHATGPILAIASINGLILLALRARRARSPVGLPGSAVGVAVLAASWTLGARWIWWADPAAWVGASARAQAALIVASLLVSINLARIGRPAAGGRWKAAGVVGTASGLVILAMASLRLDSLGGGGPSHPMRDLGRFAFYHWGAIVGPAELVRRGGWLLWDTPSQYGFLSTLAIAWTPGENVWRSFYLLNATLTFASSSVLFLALRMFRTGPLNLPFALAVTLAAVFMIPGWPIPESPAGPQVAPAVGAFRFAWCSALIAVLIAEWRAGTRPAWDRGIPIVGCACWLLGVLWSCESAVYCSVIWGPAYLVMCRRRALARVPEAGRPGARFRAWAAWAAVPVLLLGATIGLISAYYVARLGHPPDWRAFAEYVLAMRAIAMPVDPGGIVLTLLLAFGLLSVIVAATARGGDLGALGLGLGAWGLLWSGGSYFVGRSHEVNGSNISPLVVLAVAAGLLLLRRGGPALARIAPMVRLAAAPLLIGLLTVGFGVEGGLESQISAIRRGYRRGVERLLPAADEALAGLLDEAGVAPSEPVTIAWEGLCVMPARRSTGPRPIVVHEAWTAPFMLYVLLPEDRQQVYLRRLAGRHAEGGWLVVQKDFPIGPHCREMLREGYRETASFENERWRVARLEAAAPPLPR
ncbi:hypothetical protein [Tautonia plasticadhaerens]|uniref:Uncharacterized protein n=1 Tax=Tautonia plasticadhaerens TaxID=2527974 RepID=A0A518H3N5_9BACT|nr:hypothetical protein [Tautonia plasticadhaerens]QDV35475.1 hypothetical protein ElP_33780 [Tautonia plasticadhaerens]